MRRFRNRAVWRVDVNRPSRLLGRDSARAIGFTRCLARLHSNVVRRVWGVLLMACVLSEPGPGRAAYLLASFHRLLLHFIEITFSRQKRPRAPARES